MKLHNILISYLALSIIMFLLSSSVLAEERLKMATTTSTENSGLLYVLLPPFEKEFNVKVDVIAVGTGKALKLGENGDVDVVFVHARAAEDEFINEGFGVNRRDVMYNDFIIVGPKDDPAGIKGNSASESLKKIAEGKQYFISRGDESGTHKKEKELWKLTRIEPQGKWYLEAGQGMGATLQIADEKKAYCLVDRGTYIAYEKKVDLVILCEGDKILFNPYGIMAVNPKRHPHMNYTYAMALIGWVTSPQGQKIIGEFKKEGKVLFHPTAYQ
ncbi:MAG: substrate-binding domain-containing protein [Deltaproteobacteria bacterium]|nr:MAG: substrate-binding domain-containing protein [Deltaproteobacteria bacterium]